jgi:hypothetical protein
LANGVSPVTICFLGLFGDYLIERSK